MLCLCLYNSSTIVRESFILFRFAGPRLWRSLESRFYATRSGFLALIRAVLHIQARQIARLSLVKIVINARLTSQYVASSPQEHLSRYYRPSPLPNGSDFAPLDVYGDLG